MADELTTRTTQRGGSNSYISNPPVAELWGKSWNGKLGNPKIWDTILKVEGNYHFLHWKTIMFIGIGGLIAMYVMPQTELGRFDILEFLFGVSTAGDAAARVIFYGLLAIRGFLHSRQDMQDQLTRYYTFESWGIILMLLGVFTIHNFLVDSPKDGFLTRLWSGRHYYAASAFTPAPEGAAKGTITASKAVLYSAPSTAAKLKAYLIKGDTVTVGEQRDGFVSITFNGKGYWLNTKDM